MKADIGVVGMAVMGQNLALNMESRGYTVAVYNRTAETLDSFVAAAGRDKRLIACHSLGEFVEALQPPRRAMLMVKAGAPVDTVIEQLVPLMQEGDVLIDGGNSFFIDTIRRTKEAAARGLLFLGTGVSGGEEGALHGPSIMPGGHRAAYGHVSEILTAISAKVDGDACCTYIGNDGAGHYVKMVHNGIEYGDMQLIAEAYHLLHQVLGLSYPELHEVFADWNGGELDSYLIEITADILAKKDPDTGTPMAEIILDRAGNKGTGKWTAQSALDLGVSAPTITEAVFARFISAYKEERVAASKVLPGPRGSQKPDRKTFIEAVRRALYGSKICSYAQGFAMLRAAAAEYHWDIKMGDMAMLWRGGCIIRAKFLGKIKEAFDRRPDLPNLLVDPYFSDIIKESQADWRQVIATAVMAGIPVPAISSAIAYYDSYRTQRLPANLVQAQRDYFGAHTYERVDRPGSYHTEWTKQ